MLKRRTSISLGGGLLLALTLALSACDTGEKPAPDPSVSADTAQARVAAAPAPADCPGPAPQPFTALDPKNKKQPWSVVTSYLQQNPLASDSAVGNVRLCRNGCPPISATLRPLANTCAIETAGGQMWMMGKVKANGPLTGQNQAMFGPGNDSSYVYLLTRSDSAFVIYPRMIQGQLVVGYVQAVNSAPWWRFSTCKEPKHGNVDWGKYPASEDKPACGPMGMTADPATRDDSAGNVGEPGEELSYSWMACIGGCCRFYGPQPPFAGEEQPGGGNPGNGNPGGSNPGGGNPGGGQPGQPGQPKNP